MFPWMRGQILEAWSSRRSSREAGRRSSALSSADPGNPSRNSGVTMFVSPQSIPESFSVNIISLEGHVFGINIKPDFTIEKIKAVATKHFYGQDTSKPSSCFRLVHATKLKSLSDEKKAEEEGIEKFDELLMVEIHPVIIKENLTEEILKGPSEEVIARITAGLPIKNPSRPAPSADCPADFQNEIRKILITLVQTSAKILNHSPEAAKIYEVIRERWETRCKPPNDPKSVKYLMDMGFSEKKVLKALRLRKMNTSEALEWLIEHGDDPDEEDFELPSLDASLDVDTGGPSSSGTSGRRRSLKEACVDLFKGGSQSSKREPNLINVVALLLESFRQFKKLDFKPNTRVISSLQEMGFEEKKIIEALKVTGNNQPNACEWLLGERRPSLEDLDEGLDPDGPIYKAIMSNPHIQLSLTSPKMLLAYLSMLESPMSANIWINDPEASPVLSQIFKTYHAEKHAIHMNRFVES
ncbi:ubiquitin-associated domain-containing protein 1 [Neodiprion pinetum]|uniref:Ubiquitin-associated domain-containing protein 1 n=1 Tax=Neodiprion lecontei TaxID=441921 RepID=A0A6J0C3R0_NEOLC|nr:ubiquitin-associated domain-containing protein 1 [Neodiprion lecontei]XP_046466934.1 ubiquitin-associated domain-containing protein 1 [Neodiprion pinetum]